MFPDSLLNPADKVGKTDGTNDGADKSRERSRENERRKIVGINRQTDAFSVRLVCFFLSASLFSRL